MTPDSGPAETNAVDTPAKDTAAADAAQVAPAATAEQSGGGTFAVSCIQCACRIVSSIIQHMIMPDSDVEGADPHTEPTGHSAGDADDRVHQEPMSTPAGIFIIQKRCN